MSPWPNGFRADRRARAKCEGARRAICGTTVSGGAGPARANQGVWTALSTPPYFSALAIWPGFGHWTGGGWFLSDHAVAIGESADALTPKLNAPQPKGFRILPAASCLDRLPDPAESEAWTAEDRRRDAPDIVRGLRAEGARWVEFLSPRPDGALLFGVDGVIRRLEAWRRAPADRRLAASTPLLDLRAMRFERVAPDAEAMVWR